MKKHMHESILINAKQKLRHILPSRYLADNKGVAAVEFALLVPILLLLFVGTMEISLAVAVDRKVSRISSSVADLITQDENYNKAGLNKIADIAGRIMYPYDDEVKISIVGIKIENNQAKVAWAHPINGGEKPAEGSIFEVPASIKTNDTFLLSATVGTSHKPAFSFIGYDGDSLSFDDAAIELEEQMFLRPRKGGDIDCSDC
ncbi:MAG: TadE/TadG family type IV pilus assembly protein [Pseudomonadota bacterium]